MKRVSKHGRRLGAMRRVTLAPTRRMFLCAGFAGRNIASALTGPREGIEAAFDAHSERRVWRNVEYDHSAGAAARSCLAGLKCTSSKIHVICMRRIIRIVADGMLPEAALPDAAFAGLAPDARQPLGRRQAAHKEGLDQATMTPGGRDGMDRGSGIVPAPTSSCSAPALSRAAVAAASGAGGAAYGLVETAPPDYCEFDGAFKGAPWMISARKWLA